VTAPPSPDGLPDSGLAQFNPFRPVDWDGLDQEQATRHWACLAGFVDEIVERYGLTETIPACWYAHPAMREELSALHIAWTAAYTDPRAPADAGLTWHDQLDRVLTRLREWDRGGCATGTHRPDHPSGDDPASADRRAAIDRDIAARPPPLFPHPLPTPENVHPLTPTSHP
jgi:hypothetical protein